MASPHPHAPNAISPSSSGHAGQGQALLYRLMERRTHFLRFVQKRVRSPADAEDLLQQSLLKASEHITSLRSDERLDAWFYRMPRNAIMDHRAAHTRRESLVASLSAEPNPAAPAEAAMCACSIRLFETLRPEYAEVLRQVDMNETRMNDLMLADARRGAPAPLQTPPVSLTRRRANRAPDLGTAARAIDASPVTVRAEEERQPTPCRSTWNELNRIHSRTATARNWSPKANVCD